MKALCKGFKNWETGVHSLHKIDKPNIIDRLSLFNAGLSNKSVIELFNTLSLCIDKDLFKLNKLDLSNNEFGIGAMRVLCDVLNIYSSSFGNCIESIDIVNCPLLDGFNSYDLPLRIYLIMSSLKHNFSIVFENKDNDKPC